MKKKTLLSILLAALLVGCALPGTEPGLSEVVARPGERALLAGWRAYDDAQYADAERELKAALTAGLQSTKDRAAAHKLLAFVYCTSARVAECEQSFRAARGADPAFVLTRAEAGHPLWGPVYRKVVGN
jgi:Tfp pilus assembly protein PilF